MKRLNSRKRGAALIYVAVALTGLTALTSLAVDLAHVRLVKLQLQCAADSSSRSAARSLRYGTGTAQSAAVSAAHACIADGVGVIVDPAQDVDMGLWANNTFTVLSGPALSNVNAVRVRCVHTAARGNPVAVFFGSLLGLAKQDVSAQAVAVGTPSLPAGFIGYNGVSAKNNAFFGSYKSSLTTNPTQNTAGYDIRVGSNSSITAKNNNVINGDPILGPSANVSGFTVTGTTSFLASPIPVPNMPVWNPQTNPGNLPLDYVTGSTTTLPGGTYYFNSLSISTDLTFTGPTTIYVNGPSARRRQRNSQRPDDFSVRVHHVR
jgi:hypothetical protein